jgi:hypothetical protein
MDREDKEKRKELQEKNHSLSVALCALASLRLCVKFASSPRHMLRHEMGLIGDRMRARAHTR